jgi:molybdopterin synthase catalytic subunit/molybdopterin converting factor small subunit
MMQVRVLPFGVLKEWLGFSASIVELPDDATVADLLKRLADGQTAQRLSGIAVSVNADIATASQVLCDGDEVGLLPPVSGGAGQPATAPDAPATPDNKAELESSRIALTREPIDADRLIAAAKQGEDGAVVVFDGIVRNNSHARQTVHLDYEAYEEMALKEMNALARDARTRFAVRYVTMVHRLGRLQVGETSVLIIVASAHRAEAFDACRWLIDTLKKTVPIWKKETFVDGAAWAAGEPFPASMAVAPPEASHDA